LKSAKPEAIRQLMGVDSESDVHTRKRINSHLQKYRAAHCCREAVEQSAEKQLVMLEDFLDVLETNGETSLLSPSLEAPAATDGLHHSIFFRIDKNDLAQVAGWREADAADIDSDVDNLPAHSFFEMLGTSSRSVGDSSLVRVQTSTGRKHQVRRHLQSIGCPIFLDPLEPAFAQTRRGKKRATSQAGALGVSVSTQRRVPKPIADAADGAPAGERIFLHAARLCIQHPRTGLQLSVEAPPPKWWGPVLADLELSI
jgi:hypothetical protein